MQCWFFAQHTERARRSNVVCSWLWTLHLITFRLLCLYLHHMSNNALSDDVGDREENNVKFSLSHANNVESVCACSCVLRSVCLVWLLQQGENKIGLVLRCLYSYCCSILTKTGVRWHLNQWVWHDSVSGMMLKWSNFLVPSCIISRSVSVTIVNKLLWFFS